jgi:hypothetical protein
VAVGSIARDRRGCPARRAGSAVDRELGLCADDRDRRQCAAGRPRRRDHAPTGRPSVGWRHTGPRAAVQRVRHPAAQDRRGAYCPADRSRHLAYRGRHDASLCRTGERRHPGGWGDLLGSGRARVRTRGRPRRQPLSARSRHAADRPSRCAGHQLHGRGQSRRRPASRRRDHDATLVCSRRCRGRGARRRPGHQRGTPDDDRHDRRFDHRWLWRRPGTQQPLARHPRRTAARDAGAAALAGRSCSKG